MKKLVKKFLSISLILLTLSLVLRSDAEAKTTFGYNLDFGKDVTISKDEVVEGPYLNIGDTVTISGTANGDVYVGGGVVTVEGTINGDLIVGGGVVTIKGTVSDDVRAVGGMVAIDGKVGKSVTALGGSVVLGSDANIGGDILAGGGSVTHLGNINGRALIYGDEVALGGRVGSDVAATAEKLTVLKTAILDGNLAYTSDKEASVSGQAKIAGTVQRTATGKALTQVVPGTRKGFLGLRFGFHLLSYLSMLLLGLVLLKIAPRQVSAVGNLIGEQPWKSMGLGFLALTLTPVALAILLVTIIGIPLAIILGGIYILTICLSSLFTGLFVGQKIFDWAKLKENLYAMLALGLLILQLIFALPILGLFTQILSVLLAVGALLMLQREALRRLEARK